MAITPSRLTCIFQVSIVIHYTKINSPGPLYTGAALNNKHEDEYNLCFIDVFIVLQQE